MGGSGYYVVWGLAFCLVAMTFWGCAVAVRRKRWQLCLVNGLFMGAVWAACLYVEIVRIREAFSLYAGDFALGVLFCAVFCLPYSIAIYGLLRLMSMALEVPPVNGLGTGRLRRGLFVVASSLWILHPFFTTIATDGLGVDIPGVGYSHAFNPNIMEMMAYAGAGSLFLCAAFSLFLLCAVFKKMWLGKRDTSSDSQGMPPSVW